MISEKLDSHFGGLARKIVKEKDLSTVDLDTKVKSNRAFSILNGLELIASFYFSMFIWQMISNTVGSTGASVLTLPLIIYGVILLCFVHMEQDRNRILTLIRREEMRSKTNLE